MRLLLSYSPTNWIFCAMAQNLAITAKVTNLGRKEAPLPGKANIALVLLAAEGCEKQKGWKWTRQNPSKLHTPPSTCPSLSSAWHQLQPNLLSRSGISLGNNCWNCPKPLLPEGAACVRLLGSPDLHWHSCKERAQSWVFWSVGSQRGAWRY